MRDWFGREAEPSVVLGIAQQQNEVDIQRSATVDAGAHERCANALPAMGFSNRQGGKLDGPHQTRRDGDRAEADMADDLTFILSDEGKEQIAVRTQIVDKPADWFAGKRLGEQGMDSGGVSRPLVVNEHPG
jgi:hypothetical protein